MLQFKPFFLDEASSGLRTGLVTHEDMLLHDAGLRVDCPDNQNHLENPKRTLSILDAITKSRLYEKCSIVMNFHPSKPETLLSVHSPKYIEKICTLWDKTPVDKRKKSMDNREYLMIDQDSFFTKDSCYVARLAIKAVIIAVIRVLKGKWKNAFLPIRPPGHHAGTNSTVSGFCVFNNVVAAARYAQNHFGLKRILIFDWDAHHGDSTEQLTIDDPGIMYISMHRYDHGTFFPFSGSRHAMGTGEAFRTNINFPWNLREQYPVGDHEWVKTLLGFREFTII